MYVGPLTFREILKPKPWGGRALGRAGGKRLPRGVRVGESWELSDHPNGTSVVAEGPLEGRTLRELMRTCARPLLGGRTSAKRFPLLLKLIDARERLSVQVHPDDEAAKALRLKDGGKTEAWIVLQTRPGATILSGLKSAADAAQLRDLATSGALGNRLRVLTPKQGDALLCRAGTLHAIGPGVVLLEIQQNSDATFRLYDWGRNGLDGTPRSVQLAEAIQAVRGNVASVERGRPRTLRTMPFRAERLVACDKCVADRWRIDTASIREKPAYFEILHVLAGYGRIAAPDWPDIRLARGRTVLVPADVSTYRIVPSRTMEIIRVAESD